MPDQKGPKVKPIVAEVIPWFTMMEHLPTTAFDPDIRRYRPRVSMQRGTLPE